ncbi:MAG: ParB/RepB/Spo0J family partition protein [Bacilli bacterium]
MKINNISIDKIKVNKDQPRKVFDEEKLAELAVSIVQYGVLQPIIVKNDDDGTYTIIAGERRYRASVMAGLSVVPVVINDVKRYTADKIAIIENVQRDDLSAIEEAIAYASLIETYDISQSEIAKLIGKKPSTVSNKIRLLKLDNSVKDAILENVISERHGRAMLNLSMEKQKKLLEKILSKNLTVKEVEKEVKKLGEEKKKKFTQKKIIGKNYRLALNTIKQAVKMIESTGMDVTMSEDLDEELIIKIHIKGGNK